VRGFFFFAPHDQAPVQGARRRIVKVHR
jgi:hypothetical protein